MVETILLLMLTNTSTEFLYDFALELIAIRYTKPWISHFNGAVHLYMSLISSCFCC